jgi:hypothetical protein
MVENEMKLVVAWESPITWRRIAKDANLASAPAGNPPPASTGVWMNEPLGKPVFEEHDVDEVQLAERL